MSSRAAGSDSFPRLVAQLAGAIDSLSSKQLILFGGKGGVGKTTLASLAALQVSAQREVILFSTDPASNTADVFDATPPRLTLEQLDAESLYRRFLDRNLETLLEIGDRGTYFEREELRRFFELSIPGVDELMAWLRIGEIAAERPDALLVVDTAPTGHTLRMLHAADHFDRFASVLESMQSKHAELVYHLARRSARDSVDAFIESFRLDAARSSELLADARRAAFVAVTLAEPIVLTQTTRLRDEVTRLGIAVPFVVLNHATADCSCPACERRREGEATAGEAFPQLVPAPRACFPLDRVDHLRHYLAGSTPSPPPSAHQQLKRERLHFDDAVRLLFFAGKGGVGKTSAASSVALQQAAARPDRNFVLISVDPAHSVVDLFPSRDPLPNLTVETIDTRAAWGKLREEVGDEVRRVLEAMTPSGFHLSHDTAVMQQLIDIGPPGADEIFAVMRLSDLLADTSITRIFVDTAPTGHFLRLLDLPSAAGGWTRELMRLLLRYRELVPPGTLGERLVEISRALSSFEKALATEASAAVVVTRPDLVVVEETRRLVDAIESRSIRLQAVVANYLTPDTGCDCDTARRRFETQNLALLGGTMVVVERAARPPVALEDLQTLIPMRQTDAT